MWADLDADAKCKAPFRSPESDPLREKSREVGCSCFRVVETFLVAAGRIVDLWIGKLQAASCTKVTKVCYVAYVAMWPWLTGIGWTMWTTWTYASLQTKETRQLIGKFRQLLFGSLAAEERQALLRRRSFVPHPHSQECKVHPLPHAGPRYKATSDVKLYADTGIRVRVVCRVFRVLA